MIWKLTVLVSMAICSMIFFFDGGIDWSAGSHR